MRPHEETWTVVGCGNPAHGPEWRCWKVKNERAEVVLNCVNNATAQRYAAFPAMARALLALGEPTQADDLPCWCFMQASDGTHRKQCERVRALLKEAGVLE